MKTTLITAGAAAIVASLLVSSFALAQDAEIDGAPTPPTAAPPAAARAPSGCFLGTHAGIPEADAQTAASIVCSELSRHATQPAQAGASYRVVLGKLGSVVILSLTQESSPGVIQEHKQLQLSGIEEVSVAAPRIVDALVNGTPIAQTQKVDNVVGEEARMPKKRPGSAHFAAGLIGVLPPLSQGAAPAPGIDLALHYETTSFAAGVGLRGAGGKPDKTELGYFALTVGGRYYLSDADIAPYVGGGIAWSWLSVHGDGFNGDKSGLGAFGEVGIEALRSHRSHLTLGLRADLPFYALHGTTMTSTGASDGYGGYGYSTTSTSLYYVPLTVGLTFTF
jgi:hypothetical protein